MQRIKTYIGFAIRSNHIIKGLDDITKSRKKIYVIVLTDGLMQNSIDKLDKFLENKDIKKILVNSQVFSDLNIDGVKVLGITDKNLADAIIKHNNIN